MSGPDLPAAAEARFYEMLERCKDRNYISSNKSDICDLLKENRERVSGCLGSKRNIFLLKLMERVGVDPQKYLPDLEDKKNINQHVYSTYHYLNKARILDNKMLENVQHAFSCMKNCEKMFVDTENLYIINAMENDRRRLKQQREECNRMGRLEEELEVLMLQLPELRMPEVRRMKNLCCDVKAAYVIDVDSTFDISRLRSRTGDEAKAMIRILREGMVEKHIVPSQRCSLGALASPEEKRRNEQTVERLLYCIDGRKFSDSALFYSLDNLLGNRITRLYAAISGLRKMGNNVYLFSMCSLAQFIAELVLFEYIDIDFGRIVSGRDVDFDVLRRIQEIEKSRVVYVSDGSMKPTSAKDIVHIRHSTLMRMGREVVIPELKRVYASGDSAGAR
jgi:hypothetical protein